jgi:hypothetical protein
VENEGKSNGFLCRGKYSFSERFFPAKLLNTVYRKGNALKTLLISKLIERAVDLPQVVEHLPSKWEALSLNPSLRWRGELTEMRNAYLTHKDGY